MTLKDVELYRVIALFQQHNMAYKASYLTEKLKVKYEYKNPDEILRDVANNGFLVINTLQPLFFLLSSIGREIWKKIQLM